MRTTRLPRSVLQRAPGANVGRHDFALYAAHRKAAFATKPYRQPGDWQEAARRIAGPEPLRHSRLDAGAGNQ
jgi:hypothetical protein